MLGLVATKTPVNRVRPSSVKKNPEKLKSEEAVTSDILVSSTPVEKSVPSLPRRIGTGIAKFAGRVAKDSLSHAAMAVAIPAATFAVSLAAPVAAPVVALGLGAGVGLTHWLTSPKYEAPKNAPALTERSYKDAALGKAVLAGTTTALLGGLGAGLLGSVLPFIGVGGAALAAGGAVYGAVKSLKDQTGEGLERLGVVKDYESRRTLDWLVLDRKPELNKEGYYDGDFFFP